MAGVVTYEWRDVGEAPVNPCRIIVSYDTLVVVDISGAIIPLMLNPIRALTARERAIWKMQINTGYYTPEFVYNAATSRVHLITSNQPYDLKRISPLFHKVMTATTPFIVAAEADCEFICVYARNYCWRFDFDGKWGKRSLVKAHDDIRDELYTGKTSPVIYHGQDNVLVMFQPDTNAFYIQFARYFMRLSKIPMAYKVINIGVYSCTSIAVILQCIETGKCYIQYCTVMYDLGHCYELDGLPEWCLESTTKMYMAKLIVVFVSTVGIASFSVDSCGPLRQSIF